jgi:hypothetical protein
MTHPHEKNRQIISIVYPKKRQTNVFARLSITKFDRPMNRDGRWNYVIFRPPLGSNYHVYRIFLVAAASLIKASAVDPDAAIFTLSIQLISNNTNSEFKVNS